MSRIGVGIGEAVSGLIGLALSVAIFSVSTGVVHEHCLDVAASQAAREVKVESHWAYIMWPPLPLAALDPAGRCVRNNPGREGLNAVGIWKLPSPQEQVRKHVLDQINQRQAQ